MRFCVYVDYLLDGPTPIYVGKGSLQRAKRRQRNAIHTKLVEGREWYRVIVSWSNSDAEALSIERSLIRYLGTRDHQGGANLTDGGDGPSGYKRKNPLTKEQQAALGAARRGWKHSPEWIAWHSNRMTGRVVSEETRRKMAQAKLGKRRPFKARAPRSPETRARISASKKAKALTATAEQRERMSASQRERRRRERATRA